MTDLRQLRPLVTRVYLPALLATLGEFMLVVTLPLHLRELGMSFSALSGVLAAAGVGAMVFNVPAGVVIARFGDRRVMAWGMGLGSITTMMLAVATGSGALFAVRFVAGIGTVTWLLSRQTFMYHEVDLALRGRAMSTLGGIMRFALLIGPALGGWIATTTSFETSFIVAGGVSASGVLMIAALARGEGHHEPPEASPLAGLRHVLIAHTGVLLRAGFAQLCTATIRQGRLVVVPLYGAVIGLDAAQIGLVMSISAGLDLVLFPVSGYLMDRFGRLFAIVPAFTIMGVGLAMVAATDDFTSLVLAGLVIGLGNGLSAGTMLTLSTDLAPPEGPSEFLGALGLLRDLGKIAAPLIVGIIADAVSLGTSAVVLGGTGFVAAAAFVVLVGETNRKTATSAKLSGVGPVV